MNSSLAGVLLVDGLTHGAVYMQLAVASVLVFSVTRVIFVAQGEFVTFGALTLTSLLTGRVPGTLWLMVTLAIVSVLLDALAALRRQQQAAQVALMAVRSLALPALLALKLLPRIAESGRMAVRSSVFRTLGGFDETFFVYAEDARAVTILRVLHAAQLCPRQAIEWRAAASRVCRAPTVLDTVNSRRFTGLP